MFATVPEDLVISHGSHQSRADGMCVMELVAYLAGEPHTVTPACACPIVTKAAQVLNDGAPNDETRTRVLRPYLGRLATSRADRQTEERRVWALVDLSVRTIAADAMEMAHLPIPAATLRGLARVHTIERAKAAEAAAWDEAWAARRAWAAARAAAWAARTAEAAAWDAAGAAWERYTVLMLETLLAV